MLKKLSIVPDQSSGVAEKSSVVALRECRALIVAVVGERPWDEKLDELLNLAAHRSALPKRTMKALYYGEISDPAHPALIILRNAAERYEREDLANRLEQLAARVRAAALR